MGRRLQTQLLTLPTNLYSSVQIRPPVGGRKGNLYRLNQQQNFKASQSKLNELSTLEPGGQVWIGDKDRYGLVTGKTEKPRSYFVTSYRKEHTPTKPLCLISRSKTRCSRTTPSFAGLWCQSCLASTCHSCIASAQHSVETSDYEGALVTTNCCSSSYPKSNTGWVRTSTVRTHPRWDLQNAWIFSWKSWLNCVWLRASHDHFDLLLLFLLLFLLLYFLRWDIGLGIACWDREVGYLD